LLLAFVVGSLGMLMGILRVLLRLGGMFLTLGMVIPTVSFGSSTMGLRGWFVVFRRLVVFFLHLAFSLSADRFRRV
jgi:hypothetical protein